MTTMFLIEPNITEPKLICNSITRDALIETYMIGAWVNFSPFDKSNL